MSQAPGQGRMVPSAELFRLERQVPGARRLWGSLARVARREEPTRGADVMGEQLEGWVRRWWLRRLPWRRADGILARAGSLVDLGERAFDEAVERARAGIVLGRDDPARVDEAYAVGFEAVRRGTGLRLHPVQVVAALVMSRGCCAELATGEGKTLTAILPAAIDGWLGRGVHIVTVNDYLARRDRETTKDVFRRLGLSVGCVQDSSSPAERRAAYACGVTYAADKQVIFDHLRDLLASPLDRRVSRLILDELSSSDLDGATRSEREWGSRVVQRGLSSAIVDECDSVLVDDAVTPAIISAEASASAYGEDGAAFVAASRLGDALVRGADFLSDVRRRRVELTHDGREKLRERAGELPAFWSGARRREELVVQALIARELFHAGDDYIVGPGEAPDGSVRPEVKIVDRSTGRILPGRQWQMGLHQAVEAKEGLAPTPPRETSARSSYQAFFARYSRLAGMTGTAREVAGELWRWYRLPVVRVPTHKPVARRHLRDRLYATEDRKLRAVVELTERWHREGRPVLVGTRAITTSNRLAAMLGERGLACDVLNAERESEEAGIVARAGRAGAITVSTNMAGRGTDIALEPESRRAGGLGVIATERHDEARVDRQLFGRSGRQGDPGVAVAFMSGEDHLLAKFGTRPLVWLALAAPPPFSRPFVSLVRRTAQWSASRHWALLRAEAAKAEASLAKSMHTLSR